MAVFVTGTPTATAQQRIVLALNNSVHDSDNMHLTFPAQKVDTHVLDRKEKKNYFRLAYPQSALLGRDLQKLLPAFLCALRR